MGGSGAGPEHALAAANTANARTSRTPKHRHAWSLRFWLCASKQPHFTEGGLHAGLEAARLLAKSRRIGVGVGLALQLRIVRMELDSPDDE